MSGRLAGNVGHLGCELFRVQLPQEGSDWEARAHPRALALALASNAVRVLPRNSGTRAMHPARMHARKRSQTHTLARTESHFYHLLLIYTPTHK